MEQQVIPSDYTQYAEAVEIIKHAIERCRYRSAAAVNKETLSCFYLSHTSLLVTFCHSFSRSMTFRMLYATDVMLFLMDDSAEDRVDTETERVPSLDCRNAPLPRTFCHRDWMNEFSRSASNRITTRRILFTRMEKPFLQAKRASMSSMRTETQNR